MILSGLLEKLVPFSGLQRCDPPSVMELPSPVSDEVLVRPPQDPDSGGPSQDCEILRVVDAVAHDPAELLSPPRVTQRAGLLGLRPGQAFDLVDGVDLGTVPGRALVWAYLEAHRPRCVVVSSPCTTFSRLMAICKGRMPPGRFEQNHGEGKSRLSACHVGFLYFSIHGAGTSYMSILREPHLEKKLPS